MVVKQKDRSSKAMMGLHAKPQGTLDDPVAHERTGRVAGLPLETSGACIARLLMRLHLIRGAEACQALICDSGKNAMISCHCIPPQWPVASLSKTRNCAEAACKSLRTGTAAAS